MWRARGRGARGLVRREHFGGLRGACGRDAHVRALHAPCLKRPRASLSAARSRGALAAVSGDEARAVGGDGIELHDLVRLGLLC